MSFFARAGQYYRLKAIYDKKHGQPTAELQRTALSPAPTPSSHSASSGNPTTTLADTFANIPIQLVAMHKLNALENNNSNGEKVEQPFSHTCVYLATSTHPRILIYIHSPTLSICEETLGQLLFDIALTHPTLSFVVCYIDSTHEHMHEHPIDNCVLNRTYPANMTVLHQCEHDPCEHEHVNNLWNQIALVYKPNALLFIGEPIPAFCAVGLPCFHLAHYCTNNAVSTTTTNDLVSVSTVRELKQKMEPRFQEYCYLYNIPTVFSTTPPATTETCDFATLHHGF